MIYSRELRKYYKSELKKEFLLDDNHIQELLDRRILVKSKENLFHFQFVGVLIIKQRVLFCFPKYIKNSNKKSVVKEILQLLKEYSKRENLDEDEIESLGNIEDIRNYNKLSVILFLMNDYIENGLYANDKIIDTINGDSEINWIKTMDEIQPLINNGEPIYLDYYTNATLNDDENYFRQLHKYILNKCTRKLIDLGLIDYFEIDPIIFEVKEDTLGTLQSIISRISNELNVQFINRKQLLLKAMKAFISNEIMDTDNSTISFYGTRSFHVVWEKICGYVLSNKYENLKKLIASPKWTTITGKVHTATTLIPDIISVTKESFIISDAKYYSIELTDEVLSGNPGVEDVTKQYLYQLAFNEYIKHNKFTLVKNLLLFPNEDMDIKQLGKVTLSFLKNLPLEDIELISLPAHKIFQLYSNGKKLDIEKFLNFEIYSNQ